MIELYNNTCEQCSKLITNKYSTSFSLGIKMFDPKFRTPIYNIYGFVRFADEIVDTFHGHDKKKLLDQFRKDTHESIETRLSLSPVLHAFQKTVHEYSIDTELIDAFLDSMEMDLDKTDYEWHTYNKYIYGSAEVVGLMCLKVFTQNNTELYDLLKEPARKLGSAFQKINFLRDIKSDYEERGRTYFPGLDYLQFNNLEKQEIEADISKDFAAGYAGITQLPKGCRLGVYLAYIYYVNLFKKIKNTSASTLAEERVRVRDSKKLYLLCSSAVRNSLNML
jgi:phytoene/squalene synthetase